MRKARHVGVEQARSELPALLVAATKGLSTVITRHGKSVAVIVPIDHVATANAQRTLLEVAGTGKGLWGRSSGRAVQQLRDEWHR